MDAIRTAALYVLFAWGCAMAVTLGACLAVSVAEFRTVFRAALAASAPAMWIAPAVLLLATRTAGGEALGLGLVMWATMSLCSVRAPRRWEERRPRPEPASARLTFFGAFLLQSGALGLLLGQPLAAAGCLAAGASMWTAAARARQAYVPRIAFTGRRAVVILAFAVFMSAWLIARLADIDGGAAGAFSAWRMTSDVMQRLANAASEPAPLAETRNPVRVFSAAPSAPIPITKGVPGVIFRGRPKPAREVDLQLPRPAPLPLSHAGAVKIPFTGEYRLFRTSSGSPPPGSIVEAGTPLDSIYRATDEGGMETEAYQLLEPAIDFSGLFRVELVVASGEEGLLLASMQLVAGARAEDLAPAIFESHPGARAIVEFDVPQPWRYELVKAIRIAFQNCDPDRLNISVKVAVESLAFFRR